MVHPRPYIEGVRKMSGKHNLESRAPRVRMSSIVIFTGPNKGMEGENASLSHVHCMVPIASFLTPKPLRSLLLVTTVTALPSKYRKLLHVPDNSHLKLGG